MNNAIKSLKVVKTCPPQLSASTLCLVNNKGNNVSIIPDTNIPANNDAPTTNPKLYGGIKLPALSTCFVIKAKTVTTVNPNKAIVKLFNKIIESSF